MEEASAREHKRPREGDTATSAAAAAAGQPQYTYQPIADTLKVSDDPVCLFAAVAEIGAAVPSKGTDFTVTLRIADQSLKAGVSATFFAKKTSLLPCVKSCGDVISLHKVKIKQIEKEFFFVAFEKSFSSFALFDGKVSAGYSPYQTSMKYHGTKHDKELLTKIRTWLPNNPLGLKDLELQLRSLKTDSTFDLVCKVLHVLKNNDKWIFYVWDGTDTPSAEFQTISDAEAFESQPLLEEPPLPRDVLSKMPRVGTVLRIFSNTDLKKARYMEKDIYWVRFYNITCKQEQGIWKGITLDSSGVRLLAHEDGSVVDRLRMYDSRNTSKVHRLPMASFPSNVADVKYYSTLMESLNHHEVTHKVRTLVRVVAPYPCRASASVLSTGNYSIWLTLEDPTARIRACVYKAELVNFFGGLLTEEIIIKKMNKLLGVPELENSEEGVHLTRNPPWIWCCLMSYYLDEKDRWGSRRYRIGDMLEL